MQQLDWEPPAPPSRGTCEDCGRRRIVYDNDLCRECNLALEERRIEEDQLAQDAADGLFDDVLYQDPGCYFEFDGPDDDPEYCVEHRRYCAP